MFEHDWLSHPLELCAGNVANQRIVLTMLEWLLI
jgi:hypothetical protein